MRKIAIVGGVVMISAVAGALGVTNSVEAANTRYTTTFKLVDKTTGKTLRTIKISGVKNRTYTFQPNKIQYYATPKAVKYTVRRTGTIKVNYVATYRKVTIKSIDAFDHRVIQNNTKMVKVGTTPLIAPVAAAKGYSLSNSSNSIKLSRVSKDTSVIFKYDQLIPVTVKYMTTGTDARTLGVVKQSVRRGVPTVIKPKNFDGYTMPKSKTMTIVKSSEISFNYSIDKTKALSLYNNDYDQVTNKDIFEQAMKAYKSKIDRASTVSDYHTIESELTNLKLSEYWEPRSLYAKNYNSDHGIQNYNLKYSDSADNSGTAYFPNGLDANYIAYLEAKTDRGDYYWVVNQRTQTGGWVAENLLNVGGIDSLENGDSSSRFKTNFVYSDKITKNLSQIFYDEHSSQASLDSIDLFHNVGISGLKELVAINPGDKKAMVRLNFSANGESNGTDYLMNTPRLEISDGQSLTPVNAMKQELFTNGTVSYLYVVTDDEADSILLHGATIHYGIDYQGRNQPDGQINIYGTLFSDSSNATSGMSDGNYSGYNRSPRPTTDQDFKSIALLALKKEYPMLNNARITKVIYAPDSGRITRQVWATSDSFNGTKVIVISLDGQVIGIK